MARRQRKGTQLKWFPHSSDDDPYKVFAWIEKKWGAQDDIARLSGALLMLAFVFARRGKAEISGHLVEYASRLQDLRDGTIHPMFRPERRASRASDSSSAWSDRAMVAVAVQAMRRTTMTRGEAATWVARRMPKEPPLLAPHVEPEPAVLSWMDEFRKKRVKASEVGRIYDLYMHLLARDVPRGGERDYANWLLKAVKTKETGVLPLLLRGVRRLG